MADSRFLKVDGAFQRPIPWNAINISKPMLPGLGGGPVSTSARTIAPPATTSAGGGSPLPSSQGSPTPQAPGSNPVPQGPAAPDPATGFNTLMMDLLKSAQGLGTADLLKRKRELERASTASVSEMTPEALRTLSPGQQEAIRSGKTDVLSPEIDANAYEIEKAQQSIDSFFKVYGEASKMSQDFAEKMVAPESVIANAQKIIQSNPDDLSTVLASFNDKSKQKILEGLDYSGMAATRAALKKTTGGGGSNQMTDNERALMTSFRGEQIVKDYNVNLNKKLSVEAIIKAGVGGPGDLALVFEFMKALDPNSVVRETEYATAAKSGNIFAGVFARFNGYLKEEGGFLPPQVQQAFLSLVNAKFEVQRGLYENTAAQYRDIAKRQGLNPENVVINYAGAAPGKTYTPGTIISNNGTQYKVGEDGESLTEVKSSGGVDFSKINMR